MRVKLAYTVEEDKVLNEASKIINLAADDMQHTIHLFSAVQKALKSEDAEKDRVDIALALEMIDEYRRALFNIDTRLAEVSDIVESFDDYRRQKKNPPLPEVATQATKAETK
jgi:hypothetical protein